MHFDSDFMQLTFILSIDMLLDNTDSSILKICYSRVRT